MTKLVGTGGGGGVGLQPSTKLGVPTLGKIPSHSLHAISVCIRNPLAPEALFICTQEGSAPFKGSFQPSPWPSAGL